MAVLLQGAGMGMVRAGQQPLPADTVTIRVVPDAAMAVTDWNQLLHVLGLRVVGGPDKDGAYIVAPRNAAASIQHTVQQLRTIRGIKVALPLAHPP